MSVDGMITFHDRPGNAFTSSADKRHFVECLQAFDCSVLGRNTFEASKDFLLSQLSSRRLRVVITSNPDDYADLAVPGKLEFSKDGPEEILQGLTERGYRKCAHLGGSDAYASFQSAQCIDAWWLSVEARIFGSGRPLCPGTHDAHLAVESVERLEDSDTLLLKYRCIYQ